MAEYDIDIFMQGLLDDRGIDIDADECARVKEVLQYLQPDVPIGIENVDLLGLVHNLKLSMQRAGESDENLEDRVVLVETALLGNKLTGFEQQERSVDYIVNYFKLKQLYSMNQWSPELIERVNFTIRRFVNSIADLPPSKLSDIHNTNPLQDSLEIIPGIDSEHHDIASIIDNALIGVKLKKDFQPRVRVHTLTIKRKKTKLQFRVII